VWDILNPQQRYSRNQAYPVRGFARQRPESSRTTTITNSTPGPMADVVLLGGFCELYGEAFNTSVITGLFATTSTVLTIQAQLYTDPTGLNVDNPSQYDFNNKDQFMKLPRTDYVLGDCCVEYIAERDEAICFGGRANESDTANAHADIAVLRFNPNSNSTTANLNAQWHYDLYPPMPHPRWSAASVLIRELVRSGETEACDRIFIIGGRNRDGFVPEVDVFNLRYNQWETDWKGLDQGELETADGRQQTAGGTIINVQGSDCKAISNATINQTLNQTGFPTNG